MYHSNNFNMSSLVNLLKYNKLDSATNLSPGEILYVPKVPVKK